jgi:hypothetical protein
MERIRIFLAHQHIEKSAHQNPIFNPIAIGSSNFHIFKSLMTSNNHIIFAPWPRLEQT